MPSPKEQVGSTSSACGPIQGRLKGVSRAQSPPREAAPGAQPLLCKH